MNRNILNIFCRFSWLSIALAVLLGCFLGLFPVSASELTHQTGTLTNKLKASGQFCPDWPGGSVIRIFVHFKPPNTNITFPLFPTTIKQTNGSVVGLEPGSVAKYFLATNSFCGLVELRNASGNVIPTLKPEVNSQEAYPTSYRLNLTRRLLVKNIGLGPDLPMAISGNDAEISCFQLKRYFTIPSPGDYQLTVWPKIYKRSETNRDLCKRIDLSPVTIPIKWMATQ